MAITKNEGNDIVITKDEWHQTKDAFKGEKLQLTKQKSVLHFEYSPVTRSKCFIYHQAFDIAWCALGNVDHRHER